MSYFVFYVDDTATKKPSTQSYTKIKDHKVSSESVLLYVHDSLTSRNFDVQFLCWYMTA